jgi:hypothetical protein
MEILKGSLFRNGYTLTEEHQLRGFAARSAVTRVAWSVEQGEHDYAVAGRTLLKYLGKTES